MCPQAFYVLLLLGFLAYFICAVVMDPSRAVPLISLTGMAVVIVLYWAVKRRFGKNLFDCVQPLITAVNSKWHIIKWWEDKWMYVYNLMADCQFLLARHTVLNRNTLQMWNKYFLKYMKCADLNYFECKFIMAKGLLFLHHSSSAMNILV